MVYCREVMDRVITIKGPSIEAVAKREEAVSNKLRQSHEQVLYLFD